MKLLKRLKAAWFAFKCGKTYRDGYRDARVIRENQEIPLFRFEKGAIIGEPTFTLSDEPPFGIRVNVTVQPQPPEVQNEDI